MTASEFAELCRQLRELGASTVEAHGFRATFHVPAPYVAGIGRRPMSEDAQVLTPEQAKLAQRNKELGRG